MQLTMLHSTFNYLYKINCKHIGYRKILLLLISIFQLQTVNNCQGAHFLLVICK